jgi:CDP-diacylglycerol--glycerol-3-phosphate 3-phosphatidyltransferase
VPIFCVLVIAADHGHSWPAAIVFGVAGLSDQLDGYLARRWRVESAFGRVADPLADRLMIDAAVILLCFDGRLPWIALAVIIARDALLILGYKVVMPEEYELNVSFLGKAATWLLYAAIFAVLITHDGDRWPLWLFWTGLALAVVAGVGYGLSALRGARR